MASPIQKTSLFNCNKCFKTITAKHNLNTHTQIVHKKLEMCPICGRVVKNLVQHNTRYHAYVSKGRRQCQYCLRWYIRICRHKCSRQSRRSLYVPRACAPLRTTEDLEPLQVFFINSFPKPSSEHFHPISTAFNEQITTLAVFEQHRFHKSDFKSRIILE